MGNTFGRLFRITTFGESHGKACGVVIDGVPPNFELTAQEIQSELDRRKPGQSSLASPRQEADQVQLLSGVEDGLTLGTPVALIVYNKDVQARDYQKISQLFRPSHADFCYQEKYGIQAKSGGGRASARETLARVAAGAIAQKFLRERLELEIVAWVHSIHQISGPEHSEPCWYTRQEVEQTPIRCPYPAIAEKMIACIETVKEQGDSVGGTIKAQIRSIPAGLGEPVFDKLEAELGKAILSLPACKGIEFGSGFEGTRQKGSENNDPFYLDEKQQIQTRSNHSGGIQGGISNGQWITLKAAFKPTATIRKAQETLTQDLQPATIKATGRHDPCVLPRAVPIVEAMISLVLMDAYLIQQSRKSLSRQVDAEEEVF